MLICVIRGYSFGEVSCHGLHGLHGFSRINLSKMENVLYKTEAYDIVGACMPVHNYLGHGFLEVVYKDAVELEFLGCQINFEREKKFDINYKSVILLHKFYADFFVMDKIIVEIKSTKEGISKEYITQTLNYLKVSGCKLGLIINFGKLSLEYKRLIF